LRIAAPTLYNYTTIGNVTFVLNTSADTMEGAEANCKQLGGHLAAFTFRKLRGAGTRLHRTRAAA
jgi:hypothetical protein